MIKRKAAKLHHPSTKVQVKVDIRSGPASEFQKKQWLTFWRRLAAQAEDEGQGVVSDGR